MTSTYKDEVIRAAENVAAAHKGHLATRFMDREWDETLLERRKWLDRLVKLLDDTSASR